MAAPVIQISDPVGEYIVGRLLGRLGGNDELDGLPLSAAVRLCERLGQIEAVGALPTLPRQSWEKLFQARAVGFRMSEALAPSVLSTLDTIVRPAEALSGLHETYGWIYGEWLATADPSNQKVRAILFDHAVRNGVMSGEERRLGNCPRETITMTQAARKMGMSYKRGRATATEAGIVPRGSRRSVAFTIDPRAIAKLRSVLPPTVHVQIAAKQLETGKARIADLVKANFLFRTPGGVTTTSISQLLDSIIGQCCKGRRPEELLDVATAARNAAVPLWQIIQAVLEGTIPCWRDDASGLSQFKVRLRDVVMLRAASPRLSVEAAARRIGVHHDCARAMAKFGTIADDGGMLTDESIERFERDYVVGAKAAREIGRSPRAFYRHLATIGVHPAFDLGTHRQAIYRRSDLSQVSSFS
ncbi:hypothetical protein ACSMXM_12120 [Pacificimonas sp. ICDLI1SI03]